MLIDILVWHFLKVILCRILFYDFMVLLYSVAICLMAGWFMIDYVDAFKEHIEYLRKKFIFLL